jgi:uncharacterized protein (TIGR02588 family)
MAGGSGKPRQGAAIEWIAGAVGLVLTLALLGFIGWGALTHDRNSPPELELRVERVVRAGGAYVAQFVAHNRAQQTAEGVEIEGELSVGTGEPERSTATFDYVPGGSSVRGGLYFSSDPRAGDLKLRALGHTRP